LAFRAARPKEATVKRSYETCVVYDGTLSDEVVSKEQQQVEQLLKKSATLEKVNTWGKRKLAYEIGKRRTGVYILFEYKAEGDVPVQLERLFKLNQNVLRYLTVRANPRAIATDIILKKRDAERSDKAADEKKGDKEAGRHAKAQEQQTEQKGEE
jgi:small subunit ribosomal protein S6